MKKVLIVVGILVVLLVAAFVLLGANLGRVVKAGIERIGPQFTKTPVTVESVALSVRSGTGALKGFTIGNPPPYTSPSAVRFGEIALAIDPASVGSDKVVVRSIRISDAEVTLEGGLQDNNLKQLAANLQSAAKQEKSAPAPASASEPGAQKKLQVDELILSGVKVNLILNIAGVANQASTLTLPDIQLKNLGSGPDGITPAELSSLLMQEVVNQVAPAVTKNLGNLTQGVLGPGNKKATDAINQATKGLDGLLKKK